MSPCGVGGVPRHWGRVPGHYPRLPHGLLLLPHTPPSPLIFRPYLHAFVLWTSPYSGMRRLLPSLTQVPSARPSNPNQRRYTIKPTSKTVYIEGWELSQVQYYGPRHGPFWGLVTCDMGFEKIVTWDMTIS